MTNFMKVNLPAVVTCAGLTKIYHTGTVALDNLTLSIEPGMSFGLMGENGAGKSTLVKLLMGFIFPTKGQLSVLGEKEVRRAHSRIGYLHERPYVELRFTAGSYLTYMAQLSGYWNVNTQQRVQSVLDQVDLSAASDERLSMFSKGMLQRLSIAQTILVSVLTVALSSPISTRLTRILFLTWIAFVLFSISPLFRIPTLFLNVLGIVIIPLCMANFSLLPDKCLGNHFYSRCVRNASGCNLYRRSCSRCREVAGESRAFVILILCSMLNV